MVGLFFDFRAKHAKQVYNKISQKEGEIIMLGDFETGGMVVLLGYALITVASVFMVRYFNKKIREQHEAESRNAS
ncbi:hypothetical protein FEMY_19020 [Ferrovum myxofaciens]|jgi:endonuclease/exonuclease/phosphatase (EEP) superfamily protein YafD|uniref:Uncharacterized protein n=1 Tax=Ferrovum myxofaciens TaxID=416213 RepID=A0A149VWF6_9PROT|nr:hypothetical protein FEMY_19020 [Ferrovum myxofaciens]